MRTEKRMRMIFSMTLIFTVVMSYSFSEKTKTKMYTYVDGNNNVYEIIPESINYIPIKPEESSSGTYSGGEPKKVSINADQFSKIESIIKAILKDKSNYADERRMGYGTLVIGNKTMFINSASTLKRDLEIQLNAYLQ